MQNIEDARGDIVLIERIVARDEHAVADLYDRHCRLLFGLILRILRDRSESEEVLQDVFVLVWTRAETYNVSLGPPAAWLVRIARNRAIDRLRANSVRLRAVESVPEPAPVENPESQARVSEQQRAVARALDTLPPDQRVLIEQAYFLGLTQSELAERFKECYVVSGSIFTCGRRLGPGDFVHADADTDHGELWTDEGAQVILIVPPEEHLPASMLA